MERQVKERLVGAAVLMAAAIILIPEMLSGPDRHRAAGQGDEARINFGPGAARDTPVKTYTIDLTRPPGTQTAAEAGADPVAQLRGDAQVEAPELEALAPPAAQGIPSPPAETKTESVREAAGAGLVAASEADVSGPQAEAPAPSTVKTAKPTASATASLPSKPIASSPAAPTSGGWAVQLGSFSHLSTAQGIVKQLRAKGHDAFVMPVKTGSTTLYRVRVGPMKDRAAAEAARSKLKPVVSAATVVVHP